jgi:hypothetical protein
VSATARRPEDRQSAGPCLCSRASGNLAPTRQPCAWKPLARRALPAALGLLPLVLCHPFFACCLLVAASRPLSVVASAKADTSTLCRLFATRRRTTEDWPLPARLGPSPMCSMLYALCRCLPPTSDLTPLAGEALSPPTCPRQVNLRTGESPLPPAYALASPHSSPISFSEDQNSSSQRTMTFAAGAPRS